MPSWPLAGFLPHPLARIMKFYNGKAYLPFDVCRVLIWYWKVWIPSFTSFCKRFLMISSFLSWLTSKPSNSSSTSFVIFSLLIRTKGAKWDKVIVWPLVKSFVYYLTPDYFFLKFLCFSGLFREYYFKYPLRSQWTSRYNYHNILIN